MSKTATQDTATTTTAQAQATRERERLVVKSAVRIVDPHDLQADPSYQRDIKSGHKKIVANFNPHAFGIPLVGQRADNSLWIVDGLQRITAVKKLGHKTVRVEVFASDGPEHEAEVFGLVNIDRTKMNAHEKFRSMLRAEKQLAWDIKNAVESCGYTMSLGKSGTDRSAARQLTCTSILIGVAARYGVEPIKFALTCAREAWPEDRLGVWSHIVAGLCRFYTRMDGAVDMERFLPRLSTVSPQKLIYIAGQRSISSDRTTSIANTLEEVYRKRLVRK